MRLHRRCREHGLSGPARDCAVTLGAWARAERRPLDAASQHKKRAPPADDAPEFDPRDAEATPESKSQRMRSTGASHARLRGGQARVSARSAHRRPPRADPAFLKGLSDKELKLTDSVSARAAPAAAGYRAVVLLKTRTLQRGNTRLHQLARRVALGVPEAIDYVLQKGLLSVIDKRNRVRGASVTLCLRGASWTPHCVVQFGKTAAFLAVDAENWSALEMLVGRGADVVTQVGHPVRLSLMRNASLSGEPD
jgi:hypothetical protein